MAPHEWKRFLCLSLLLMSACQTPKAVDDTARCVQCGMPLKNYPHSLFTLEWTDGSQTRTCGVQCGLTQHLKNPDTLTGSRATDLITNRSFPSDQGFYVFKSSVTTDMGPGFIAFKDRVNAEKFRKGFGGQVVTFQEALKLWAETVGKGKGH